MREQIDFDALRRVGWFAPPYADAFWLRSVALRIKEAGEKFSQADLESIIAKLFSPMTLATLVLNRYPQTRVVSDYKEIIAESVEAHFLGLDHNAIAGLVPVIEGIGRKLAAMHGVEDKRIKETFFNLADHCKAYVVQRKIGAVEEIKGMLDSFHYFTENFLYTNSDQYSLDDGTNRHGITHGKFGDADFGARLNFYKIMSAVNFLTFVSCVYYGGSGFIPNYTDESNGLAKHYDALSSLAEAKAVRKRNAKIQGQA